MADYGAIGKAPRGTRGLYRVRFDGPQFLPQKSVEAARRGYFIPMPPVGWPATANTADTRRMIPTPTWWGSRPIGALPVPDFKIEGHVYQRDDEGNDTPIPLCRVRLHYRTNGVAIATTTTDANGFYRFKDLMPDAASYYAVAFDPDGGVNQNAVILDKLSTVPA